MRAMSRTRRSSLGDGSQTTEPKVTRVETQRVRRMAGLMRSIAKTKFTRSRPEKSRAETGRCCMKSVTTLFVCRVRLKSQGSRECPTGVQCAKKSRGRCPNRREIAYGTRLEMVREISFPPSEHLANPPPALPHFRVFLPLR